MKKLKNLVAEIKSESRKTRQSIRQICTRLAKKYNIKSESLRKVYQRAQQQKDRPHKNMEFSEIEEKIICAFCLAMATRGAPLTKRILIDFVKKLFKKSDSWSGRGWFDGFKKRHSDLLSFSAGKGLDPERVSKVTQVHIEKFINSFNYLLEYNKYQSDYVINVDESPCNFRNYRTSKVVKSAKSKRQGTIKTPQSPLRTIIPFVAASGKVWMVVYVFKQISPKSATAKNAIVLRAVKRQSRGTWPSYYATTANGYVTNDLWNNIIGKFVEVISPVKGNLPALLLLDRVGPHLQDSSLTALFKKDISTLFLPAHTSHIVQPLDDLIFATLKKVGINAMTKLITWRQIRGENLTSVVQEALIEAEQSAFNTTTIVASFKNTGIWPFDEKLVCERFSKEYMWKDKSEPIPKQSQQVHTILRRLNGLMNAKTPTKTKHAAAIQEKSMLFLGSEIQQYQKEAVAKRATKVEKAASGGANKRKRSSLTGPKVKAKKARVELESSAEESVALSDLHQCNSCGDYDDDYWACSSCKIFTLCQLCQSDVPAIENHKAKCAKK